ncbi:MAG: class I SAM-dependent methyltransferase [Candidatus Omnitrophica bacterium]|nr:class I SAM-dependent methyltransferase [Candidatus Omnitrophota bacterium]
MSVFDRYYKKYDSWYDRNRFAYLSELEAVRKVLPRKGTGLEIEVGTGRFAAALGIKTGIDPSKRMIKIAAERGVGTFLGFGENLPFKDSSFDYVLIVITLCFTKNPPQVLKEANRVLKDNGKIIIGIVDEDSFLGRLYKSKKSVFYKKANFFTIGKIADLLKTAGFGRFIFWQTIFKPPDSMKSVHKASKGFGRGGFVVVAGKKEKNDGD